ncbi:ribose-5-phosphate isomerase RpiA [Inquilinus limosus]|uniref:Ribose-5-phosphate isomerase A n=1 Tax=Inquilinus limosus TaxID=171674 RepID=A0A211ZUB8_9PROT|nr:ribose-5-phosphate isomerase RpiA [Inquilinus limosus]OWJ68799.1 ribose 5-phosphate isomerase A [Inquilinus limosus]
MTDALSPQEQGKRAAGEAAAALVQDGMRLGLGTGSTVRWVLEALARRIKEEGLRVTGIPTSEQTAERARALGIPLTDFAATEALDLCIDGADEVEQGTLRLIKGLGGALLREKIVAEASSRFIAVVDGSKLVGVLGEKAPLPVEVTAFGWEATTRRLSALGGAPVLRQRDGAPVRTDGGNLVLDCGGFAPIRDPEGLQARLKTIAGVVETGLFLGGAEQAIVGQADGSSTILKPGA